MLSKIISAAITGIDAGIIRVETDISSGLPAFHLVGQADNTVKEARERIRAALLNSGMEYPRSRMTINLSPADLRKGGSQFDLAIAVGILAASRQIFTEEIARFGFIGELSLDGSLCKTKGVLPMVLEMRRQGVDRVILPAANRKEAELAQGVSLYPASNLREIVEHFNLRQSLPVCRDVQTELVQQGYSHDFSEVKGQESAKRALTIAVAGGHGLLMTGSPSAGKTMLAERLPTVMPEMTFEEMMETTMIYSAAGLLTEEQPYMTKRPFRKPHQSITLAGLCGGGIPPRPGEITLAHHGVLFLDEAGEYSRNLLDGLRTPLEEKAITLTRGNYTCVYPADFLLVAATNPCKCGYYGDPTHSCTCTPAEIRAYNRKLSGPILERIDMHIQLQPVDYESLKDTETMSSETMRRQIESAGRVQRRRFAEVSAAGITRNGQMNDAMTEAVCNLSKEAERFLNDAYKAMNLNPRSLMKCKKLARTIADIEQSEAVEVKHLAEAIQYREPYTEKINDGMY